MFYAVLVSAAVVFVAYAYYRRRQRKMAVQTWIKASRRAKLVLRAQLAIKENTA